MDHNQPIAAAAQAALVPLGCRRVGQSRSWISDQRFWIINIEFQPSGWSKGTYLNVGTTWLWQARKGLSFHFGYRVADFIPFESKEQFVPLFSGMVDLAAQQVLALREKFKSLSRIHRHLMSEMPDGVGQLYRAAVVAGLAGDIATSRRSFDRLARLSVSHRWESELKSDANNLAALLQNAQAYRSAVLDVISKVPEAQWSASISSVP